MTATGQHCLFHVFLCWSESLPTMKEEWGGRWGQSGWWGGGWRERQKVKAIKWKRSTNCMNVSKTLSPIRPHSDSSSRGGGGGGSVQQWQPTREVCHVHMYESSYMILLEQNKTGKTFSFIRRLIQTARERLKYSISEPRTDIMICIVLDLRAAENKLFVEQSKITTVILLCLWGYVHTYMQIFSHLLWKISPIRWKCKKLCQGLPRLCQSNPITSKCWPIKAHNNSLTSSKAVKVQDKASGFSGHVSLQKRHFWKLSLGGVFPKLFSDLNAVLYGQKVKMQRKCCVYHSTRVRVDSGLARVTAESSSFQKKQSPCPKLSDEHGAANLHMRRARRQRLMLGALLVLGATQSCSG